jgi:hypothetical protein
MAATLPLTKLAHALKAAAAVVVAVGLVVGEAAEAVAVVAAAEAVAVGIVVAAAVVVATAETVGIAGIATKRLFSRLI